MPTAAPDIYSLFASPDDGTAEEQARALSAALRGKHDLGELALLSGDPVLTRLGTSQLQDADSGTQLLASAGGTRLTKLLQQRAQMREQANKERELAQGDRRIADDEARARQENLVPVQTGSGIVLVDKRTGRTQQLVGADGAPVPPKGAAPKPGDLDKRLKALQDDLDPSRARAGVLADNQKRINQAARIQALVEGSGGNLDPRQMEELAISSNALLSNSATGAASQVAALVPHTAIGDASKLAEWLTNEPTGTNQQAFVKRMLETAKREADVAKKQIRDAQVSRLASHAALKASNPNEYAGVLKSYGLDDSAAPAGDASGTVKVLDPTGKVRAIPSSMLAQALAAGGKQVP